MATPLEDIDCTGCGEEEVYMDVKEEPAIYKIGAQCLDCHHDYGVLHRVPRSNVDHVDEVYNIGEENITELLS